MNKDVQVTGLQMAATTTDDLEISLGDVGKDTSKSASSATLAASRNTPDMEDLSWRSSILFADYYSSFGKLLPGSSADGLSIYYADNNGVYGSGKAVLNSTIVYKATGDNAGYTGETSGGGVKYTLYDNTDNNPAFASGNATAASTNNDDKGYYIDIPMWIRSTSTTAQPVYCTVVINDTTTAIGNTVDSSDEYDLKKAVRVAIIPTNETSDGATDISSMTYSNNNGDLNASSKTNTSTKSLFALNTDTYQSKVLAKGDGSTTYENALTKDAPTTSVTTALSSASGVTASNYATLFTIPATSQGKYGVVSFVARIWIEGESTSCWDATANQDWNIDFYFTATDPSESSGASNDTDNS